MTVLDYPLLDRVLLGCAIALLVASLAEISRRPEVLFEHAEHRACRVEAGGQGWVVELEPSAAGTGALGLLRPPGVSEGGYR